MISLAAVEAPYSYGWPDNILELENKISRAITFTEGKLITPDSPGLETEDRTGSPLALKEAWEDIEMRLIKKAVSKNKGNITMATEAPGLTRPILRHPLKKYNITINHA